MEIENIMRKINGDIINPELPELHLEELEPVLTLVARSRAVYLKEIMSIANNVGDDLPNADQIKRIRNYRITFEELVAASQALTTAVERGYLDVKPS